MHASVLTLLFVLAAPPTKVAVMPLVAGEGISASVAQTLTGQVVSECRRQKGISVIAQDEIAQVLSLEQQRQLLGCGDSDKCRVEFGGALGVERVVVGTLGRLGESWLLHLKVMDVQNVKVLKEVDRRQKGGGVDDLLDALPGMVTTLMAQEAAPPDAPVAQGGSAPVAAVAPAPITADEPMDRALLPKKMKVATDGKGLVVAYEDGWGSDWPLFSGDGRTLTAVRVGGRGSDGTGFSMVFWDPRAKARWQAAFGRTESKGLTLQCNDQEVAMKDLPDAEAHALLAKATFLKPRWKRIPHALGRDDNGNYYLVDGFRDGEGRADLRLYVGRKAAMQRLKVDEALQERDEDLLLTPTGRLKVEYGMGAMGWVEGGVETRLKWLPVEDNARLIYLELSPYKGQPLFTPCDGRM